MPIDLPPIPPAVVEFAQKNNCKVLKQNVFWTKIKQYENYEQVYSARDNNVPHMFRYILVNPKEMRLTTDEESIKMLNQEPYL